MIFKNLENINDSNLKEILKIYNFHIINSLGNFEENTISFNSFKNKINKILNENLPLIICETKGKIVGFAYLNKFRNRSGYRYTYENSVYVNDKFLNKGIGTKLLNKLIIESKKIDKIKNIIAVIGSKENSESIKLHKKCGFNYIGSLKNVGYKKNKWLDVVLMQIEINEKNK